MIRNAGNDRMTSCDLQQYVAIVRISCRSRRLAASVMASSPRRGWRQRRRLADRTTRSYIDINPRLTARPPGPPTTIALASPLQSHSPRLALSLSLAPRHVANLSVRRRSRGTPRQSAVRTDRALSTSRHGCVLPRAPRVLFFTKLLFIANNRTWSDLVDAPHSCIDINCRLLSQTGAAYSARY